MQETSQSGLSVERSEVMTPGVPILNNHLNTKHMIYLLAPWIAAALPALIGVAGNVLNRSQSKGDIAKQNAYNSPGQQVARLRAAGLPMAAMEHAQAGTQSALPQTSGKEIGGNIAGYVSTQTQLMQLKILQEELRLKGAEADKFEAEAQWLLSGRGEDRADTNLTNTLKTKLGIEQAQERGQNITNIISQATADNARNRLGLENNKLAQEIVNLVQQRGLVSEHIEGAALDNNVKRIIGEFQRGMSEQQFSKLVLENLGQVSENEIKEIRARIEGATEVSQIFKTDMEAAMASLTYDRVKAEFDNYNQYYEFVQKVQDEMNRTPWERITNPRRTLESIVSLAYTTITGVPGNTGSLLQFMK